MARRHLIAIAVLAAAATAANAQDARWTAMADSIHAIAAATHAEVGVAVLDLTDRRLLAVNGNVVGATASTIKIAILAELCRQDIHGGARMDDPYTVDRKDFVGGSGIMGSFTPGATTLTNRDLAAMMVSVSDNSATNILIDRVGMDSVNALLARLGLPATRLRRHMMDTKAAQAGRENTSTPTELVTLLDSLYAGSVLGPGVRDEFFATLALGKSSYIPRLLPGDVRVADKPGELTGVRNDAGIVFVPGRPFAIAVMTRNARDERETEMAISRIARVAWGYFAARR